MNAIIYARGNGQEEQIKHCEEFAEKNGYYVCAAGLTLEEIESAVMTGNIDAVIVVCPTRITRKMKEIISFEKLLAVFGTDLIIAPNYKGAKKQ